MNCGSSNNSSSIDYIADLQGIYTDLLTPPPNNWGGGGGGESISAHASWAHSVYCASTMNWSGSSIKGRQQLYLAHQTPCVHANFSRCMGITNINWHYYC